MLKERLSEKNMSVYFCSKISEVPYSTLNDIVRNKVDIADCSSDTVYRLAKTLNVSMEELLLDSPKYRRSFENFKSDICHELKRKGDLTFIIDNLQADNITKYWQRKWYPEAFYLLAMLDYLCRINELPVASEYDEIRKHSLEKPLYPRDISLIANTIPSFDVRDEYAKNSIPEFKRFNIMECDIRNVC